MKMRRLFMMLVMLAFTLVSYAQGDGDDAENTGSVEVEEGSENPFEPQPDAATLYVPNAFSPNGDGINDKFVPLGTGIDWANFRLVVYNRRGNQVFDTRDPNRGWDGRINGEMAATGVYVWQIKAETLQQTSISKTGTITVVQ